MFGVLHPGLGAGDADGTDCRLGVRAEDGRRDGRQAKLIGFMDDGVASLAGEAQAVQEGLDGAGGVGPVLSRLAEALSGDDFERFLVGQRR